MKSQKELIHKIDWDGLIILDACRYDYFEKAYSDFFEGSLIRARSPASMTFEWLKRTWGGNYPDTVYVSGNPYLKREANPPSWLSSENIFDGGKRFHKVIDVWDEDANTALPSSVRKATTKARMYYPRKKLVSHFMQPHAPYLDVNDSEDNQSSMELAVPIGFAYFVARLIGGDRAQKLGNVLCHPFTSETGDIRRIVDEYDEDFLQEVYKKNLESALIEVEKLVDRLPGKTVVTADHGELLGENGLYAHPRFSSHNPILTTVPFLEVDGVA